MTERRLSGLYTLRIHRQNIRNDLNLFENVANEFSKNKRNLQFMF